LIGPPCAQASRRCETQATLRRQAAKLRCVSVPFDPFRALREPDRRRTKNGLSRSEQRTVSKPKRTISGSTAQPPGEKPLDRKSPIQVCREPDFGRRPAPHDRRPRLSATPEFFADDGHWTRGSDDDGN